MRTGCSDRFLGLVSHVFTSVSLDISAPVVHFIYCLWLSIVVWLVVAI